ncbi:MAG: hypothetical protein WBG42_16005 [Cryomorphaceae bacterium]
MQIFLVLSIALNLNSIEKFKLDTPLDEGAQYGWTVDMSGDFIAVGGPGYYHEEDHNSYRCGTVLIFQKQLNGNFTFLQRLLPPDPSVRGFFGSSLALHKNDLIIGDALDKMAPKSIGSSDSAGAVYTYRFDVEAGRWIFVNKIVKLDRTSSDRFGEEIALNDSIGLVTAGGKGRGELFVIKKNSKKEWGIVRNFRDGLTTIGEIDLNGNQLIFASDINLNPNKETQSTLWKVVTTTVDDNGRFSDFKEVKPLMAPKGRRFGKAAIQISEQYCFVNSYFKLDNGERLSNRGNVHLFKIDSLSGEWNQFQKIVSPDLNKVDFFGSSMDFQDGYLVVGALGDNFNAENELTEYLGGAYVYRLDSDSLILKSKIAAPSKAWNKFGFSVSLERETVVIGSRLESYGDTIQNAGGAYVFRIDS